MAVAGAVGTLSATPATAAQDGSLDTSFGSGGFSLASYGTWAGAAAVAVQPDGKIVTAGETLAGGVYEIIATRMTSAGQPDPSFGNGGIVTVPIGSVAFVDSGAGLALQPDGKIVMAGTGTVGGKLTFVAVRLTQDGSLDSGFGGGGIAAVPIGQNAIANAVLVDPYGRIDVAGTAQVSGINHFAVARLGSSGALDRTFGSDGVTVLPPYAAAWGMVLDSSGGLVLAGQQVYNSTQAFIAARVRADGSPDSSFGTGGIVTIPIGSTAIAYAIAKTARGKLVLSGNATDDTGAWIVPTVQLNSDGTLDRSFGQGGVAQFKGQGVNAMSVDSSGRILLAGTGAAVVRLNPNGSPDTTFGRGGAVVYTYGSNSAANGIAIQSNGMLVLGGAAYAGGSLHVLAFRVSTANVTRARVLRSWSRRAYRGKTVKVTYVLAERAAHVHLRLFDFRGGKARKPIIAVSRHDVRAGRHAVVLRLPASYRRAFEHGRRRRLLLRLTIITPLSNESAVAVT